MMRGMGLGLGVAVGRNAAYAATQSPLQFLGSALLAFWDAENAASMSLSGNQVSAWTDGKNGYAPSQAFGGSRPLYSPTSFNGRPGLTFDGVDDELTLGNVPFPIGSDPVEIWALVDQQADALDVTQDSIVAYGSASDGEARKVQRLVASGVVRARITIGTGGPVQSLVNQAVEFYGRHLVRSRFGQGCSISVDGSAPATSADVPATGSIRFRIGARTTGTPSEFAKMVASALILINPADPSWNEAKAAQLTGFLKARGGIA